MALLLPPPSIPAFSPHRPLFIPAVQNRKKVIAKTRFNAKSCIKIISVVSSRPYWKPAIVFYIVEIASVTK